MAWSEYLRGQRVTFQALRRVVYLLAVGFVWSSGALTIRAPWPRGERENGSGLQSVGVEDVQRLLAEDKVKRDAEVARQLSALVLTERISDARLTSLEQSVPGAQSRWALIALADASVFLNPAAADVLPQAPPDLNEQRRMSGSTVEYLEKTLPKLPDFYATRTTVRFEDVPSVNRGRAKSQNDSIWRVVGTSKVVVAYRDGKEVVDPREWGKHSPHPEGEGLITWGTFGPILSTVILDTAHGKLTWDHWERGSTGTVAVFRYRVPESQSHYSLAFHDFSTDRVDASHGTGYHGEVAIEPVTGAILRLTVQADLTMDYWPILRGEIMVEYGRVVIGGKIYTCPIKSVSISLEDAVFAGTSQTSLLNDVSFADYHLFRSDSSILTGNIPPPNH